MLFMQLQLVISGVTNSVYPDETAPSEQSDLGLYRLDMHFVRNFGLQNFRIFTVYRNVIF